MRNITLNKVVLTIITMSLLVPVMTGCSRALQLSFETLYEDNRYRKAVDGVFEALDSNDRKALKKLFAKNVIDQNPALDNEIEALFEFYVGPKQSDEGVDLQHSSKHADHGKVEIEIDNDFEVATANGKYYVSMFLQPRNDFDKGEEGIHLLEFATENAHESYYFMWRRAEEYEPGIYIQSSDKKRDDVIMIDGRMHKYCSIDRNLTEDIIRDLLDADNNFTSFIERIGEANASWPNFDHYYYSLENNLVAVVNIERYGDMVKYVTVADEDDELYTLWLADGLTEADID
jgi:hypothetical protein